MCLQLIFVKRMNLVLCHENLKCCLFKWTMVAIIVTDYSITIIAVRYDIIRWRVKMFMNTFQKKIHLKIK